MNDLFEWLMKELPGVRLLSVRYEDIDNACRYSGIDPDANPNTAMLVAMMLPKNRAHYLARVSPPERRGCNWPGRFDHEDNGRFTGFGYAPGESNCDHPQGCAGYNDVAWHCPFTK